MFGAGTLINAAAIVIGGILGLLFGKLLKKGLQDILVCACGLSVIFIGAAGAFEKMFRVDGGTVSSSGTMMIIVSLCIGGLVGELIGIERLTERFGEWLKKKSSSDSDTGFVAGFVSTSFTVSIGAMAILGPINDVLYGDISILLAKAVLDCVIVFAMTASYGKGCVFSVIPVVCIQGFFSLCARLIEPVMTDAALANLSLVGSILIFAVGINLVFGKKIKGADFLPARIVAALWQW